MTELHERAAVDLRELLRSGSLSPVEVTEHYLRRIDARNAALGAFARVTADGARARARALEDERADREAAPTDAPTDSPAAEPTVAGAGTLGGSGADDPDSWERPLWGLPSGDKDLWDRAGVPSGYGSRAFAGPYTYVPQVSSAIVTQLDAAGSISLGKTAAPEFGFPAYTEGLAFPPARNPWDPTRTAGGSSGGAAVAVAAGMLPFAPGSDGGGSIRIPAAACGIVGLKPSRGLLPASGGVDSLGGLVVGGPLARTVADTALLLEGMITRRPDGAPAHPYTLRSPVGPRGSYLAAALDGRVPAVVGSDGTPAALGASGSGARGSGATADGTRFHIAVSTFSPWDGFYEIAPTPEARAAHGAGVTALARLGHELSELHREPDAAYAPAFRTLWMAGASALPLDDPARLDLLEPLTRWLVGVGRKVGARELVEALGTLAAFERLTLERIAPYDAVVLPALGMMPPEIGWFDPQDPERNFEQQCQFTPYTSMINVTGLPAITVPTLWTSPTETATAGMPMGIQLVGRPGGEHTLLAIAAQLEDSLRWPDRRPPTW